MFDYPPKRLDEEGVVREVLQVLHQNGFDRVRIEDTLIRTVPVDLDLLAECYEQLFADVECPAAASSAKAA